MSTRTYPRTGRILSALLLSAGPAARLSAQCPDGTPPPCAGARLGLKVVLLSAFENRSRDTADAYLAASLRDDLASALLASHRVRLLSAGRNRSQSEYTVTGSVRRIGTMLRVATQIQRSSSGELLGTSSVDRTVAQIDDVVDGLAAQILQKIGAGTGVVRTTRRAVDPAAYDLYLRGRFHAIRRTEAEVAIAVSIFRQAVARDSTFALGWAGLADALFFANRWHLPVAGIAPDGVVRAELDAAEHALLADSTRAETWITRARAAEDLDPTSRTGTLRALRRALAIDSSDANAWGYLTLIYSETGETASARAAGRRALALDPGNLEAMIALALQYYWAGMYDSAQVWTDSLISSDPTFLAGRRISGTVALAKGRLADAEAQFGAARTLGPGPERIWAIAGLACIMAARGDTAAARSLVADATSLADSVRPVLHSAVFVAWGYTALGDHEHALQWLERYQPKGDLHFQGHLRGDMPLFALRAEPRFQTLLASGH